MEIPYHKFRYYLLFLYYKLRIFVDCSFGRRRLYLAEVLHGVNAVFRTNFQMPGSNVISKIETIFGKFKFIGDNYGYSILSPAFERPDIELFIQNLQSSLKQGKKILFLDIGANVGLYSVGVTRFVKSKRLTIIAVEPDPVYHKLLLSNLKENAVSNTKVFHVALSDRDTIIRESGFHLRRLDSLLSKSFYHGFDEIFVKMDIEGNEEDAFDGAQNLLRSGKRIQLMIEDCVNPSIVTYLEHHAFRFITKITPYDSFWELN